MINQHTPMMIVPALRAGGGLMNKIEIEVMKPGAALEAFADTWQRIEAGETPTPRLAFGSLRALFSAITEKRLELIRFVAAIEKLNTRQLAQELGRDYKNVYTDVKDLVELGLLEKDDKGRLIAPHDEIVIHTTVRDAA
jgi:predicted transcriptional regulator